MMYNPNMKVQRLRVIKNNYAAYDEYFHSGVNIIRGDNSTGKSSIMDLLFFGLGGDFVSWKPEPGSCDIVYVEVRLNKTNVVLQREISYKKSQPMRIYYGSLDESLADLDGWRRYSFVRSSDRESYSQAIFRMLDIPDVITSDYNNNITIHQILRMLYVDQLTPVNRIFRFENFDKPQLRQAVGDLLLGIFNSRIYNLRLMLREKELKFEEISNQLKNYYTILGRSGESITLDFIEQKEEKVRSELFDIENQIEYLRNNESKHIEERKNLASGIIDSLRKDISKLTDRIDNLQNEISEIEFSIEDSKSLIQELYKNLQQLSDGYTAVHALNDNYLSFCPACYAMIEEVYENCCYLCKTPFHDKNNNDRLAKVKEQIEMQINESSRLIEFKADQRSEKERYLEKMKSIRQNLQEEYKALKSDFVSDETAALELAISERGYKHRELEDIAKEKERFQFIENLQKQKSELDTEISNIKNELDSLIENANKHKFDIKKTVSEKAAYILENDQRSELEFAESPNVEFSFWDDNLTVNDRNSFSASSLTILRNAFHSALLWASAVNKQMYYPRFLMMDNIEDKGMSSQRSHNFQELLVEISSNLKSDHQIIFTTSMINPKLNVSDFTVGDYYTFDNKALNIN